MQLQKLISGLSYSKIENNQNCEIKNISSNSLYIRPASIFVAIKGTMYDGHNFVNQAIKKGAKVVVLEKDLPIKNKVTKILVSDSRIALAYICAQFFQYPINKFKVIAVTGTNGKTTVTYLLEKIFACAGYRCGVIGTVNYRIGEKIYPALNTTPGADLLQSLMQKSVLAKSKYAIIEVSSHALAQHRVDCIDFSSAIFTNLSPEHLDYHGSMDKYFACKSILFTRLKNKSWAVINVDDVYGRKLIRKVRSQVFTYGIERPAQVRAEDIKTGIEDTEFVAVTAQGKIKIKSTLVGRHNVYNILAAISVALIEGIKPANISAGVESCTSVCGRLEPVKCGQRFLVFIDYAHTDDALGKVLNYLRQLTNKNKIILVFGCGGNRDKSKRPRMGAIATELSDFVILTTDNPRSESPQQIIKDIVTGIDRKNENRYKVVLDRFQAIKQALFLAEEKDIVLIAGKGHENMQVFSNKAVHFSDRQAVQEILSNKK